jgi:aarF domain-containing kinase
LRYTIYGKTGVFDAERFIDVMQAFENFIRAAKSGGGDNLKGDMAELAAIGTQPGTSLVPVFPMAIAQPEQPVKARAALAFLLSERGNFFREFILDEVRFHDIITTGSYLWTRSCAWHMAQQFYMMSGN